MGWPPLGHSLPGVWKRLRYVNYLSIETGLTFGHWYPGLTYYYPPMVHLMTFDPLDHQDAPYHAAVSPPDLSL